jgi:hypothetical protein
MVFFVNHILAERVLTTKGAWSPTSGVFALEAKAASGAGLCGLGRFAWGASRA